MAKPFINIYHHVSQIAGVTIAALKRWQRVTKFGVLFAGAAYAGCDCGAAECAHRNWGTQVYHCPGYIAISFFKTRLQGLLV
ncbi:hypothetical protein [Mucilaginibacter psychrotolerans]|uniref:Uncharacterized protein n=1 Tax=Mucilaginibacter psychrotolerans TaxID=1524096 RepID=A0A4Y8S356_9SPHI|nr:hypothetical protein [Mucilaginibacter psychrotolerans]TFF33413.1 hypothetical protein E2R66_26130 [Mucilaginibacter psychrotolerans]